MDSIESAPSHVPGSVYEAGTIVRREGRIYRALACTARSYFASEDWEPVTIDEPARLAPASALGLERAVQASSSGVRAVSFDAAAFKAELQRELAVAAPPIADARPLAVEVVGLPPPRRWRMTFTRDEYSGQILWVDVEVRE